MTKVEEQTNIFDHNTSVGKLVFVAIISIALSSFFLSSFLAPIPLTVVYLLYGRPATFLTGAASVGVLWGLTILFKGFPVDSIGFYLLAFLSAFLVAEMILRNMNPVKGLTTIVITFSVIIGALLVAYNYVGPRSVKAEIDKLVMIKAKEVEQQKLLLKEKKVDMAKLDPFTKSVFESFEKPDVLTANVLASLPWTIFIFSFFGLGLCLYVTLRKSSIWRYKVLYTHSLKDLSPFKVPEWLVWPLIASLVLILGVDYGLPKDLESVGMNLLACLAVFYVLQGLDVYSDFLKFARIGGFIKILFLFFILYAGLPFLVILGIFDMWFNFRRFFTKTKKDEGDIL
jgi:hypothetical protein